MRKLGLILLTALAFVAGSACYAAEKTMELLSDKSLENYGWTFDNGQEFPGATGKLSVDAAEKDALRLDGDFTKGGNYVQAMTQLEDTDITSLSFLLKYPDASGFTMRIGDSSGQCHQINLKIKNSPDWQKFNFDIGSYLAEKGNSPAAEVVLKYENWGGSNDGKWHGPAKYIVLIIGPGEKTKTPTLWVTDLKVKGKADDAAAGSEKAPALKKNVRMDEFVDDELDWNFSLGQEFPGAKGGMEFVKDGFEKGKSAIKLSGDFTGGGAYVSAEKDLKDLPSDISAIKMKIKSDNVTAVSVRLGDSTGQCHQRGGFKIQNDGKWHDVIIKPDAIAGGEHWGGANDGKWHGPAAFLAINIGKGGDPKPVMLIADISADTIVKGSAQASSFNGSFEDLKEIPKSWKVQGKVSLETKDAAKGANSIAFDRAEKDVDNSTSLVMDAFPIKEGLWELGLSYKSDLYSPDSSYNGTVYLESLDSGGKVIDTNEFFLITKQNGWNEFKKLADIPKNATSARFKIVMNKTYGKFSIDELSAAYVSASPKQNSIFSAIKFASKSLGNMFYPEDKIIFDVTVECTKAWPAETKDVTCFIKDYWGAEYADPIKVKLEKGKRDKGKTKYSGVLDLSGMKFEMGKYYEIRALATFASTEPFNDVSAFVILPKAVTKNYKPVEIPFTSRDWDNRIREYFILSDRLGLRWCGIWSGWDAKPPYNTHAPGIELCKELGMGAVLGTPASAVEGHHGNYKDYDEIAFREGAKKLVLQYKDQLPIMISTGNEPPSTPDRVKENIAAYKPIYEGVKAADPNVIVIGTSCGPVEEYFKQGFQAYQDIYDFHCYEDPKSAEGAFKKYEELFAKYGGKKPICTTEIGLNSQGMTRIAITRDMIRKFAVFFANGGAHMSWFDLLYPDSEGKNVGSNGESFDVFSSKYSLYRPKLDAVCYYNMVNGICIKKFVQRAKYMDEAEAFLFRDKDNKCLVILYKERERQDAFFPMKGVGKVKMIRIDGSSTELDAQGKGLTLTVSEDPLLLFFDSADMKLADKFEKPLVAVAGTLDPVIKGIDTKVAFTVEGISTDDLSIMTPPNWKVKKLAAAGKDVSFAVTPPENTTAREGRLLLAMKNKGGELTLPMQISGKISMRVVPEPFKDGKAGVKVVLKNNSSEKEEVSYSIYIPEETLMAKGTFNKAEAKPFTAEISGQTEGKMIIEGKSQKEISLSVSNFNPLNIYTVKVNLTDSSGKTMYKDRFISGFVGVQKVKDPLKMELAADEAEWQKAPVLNLNEERQYFLLGKDVKWKGVDDLSGKLRFLWDDKNLYMRMDVKDDKYANPKADVDIWNMDGLQILVDSARESSEKNGKYEYSLAEGTKGPQAWCNYSAAPSTQTGEVKDIIIKVTKATDGTGSRTYEIAIPWQRLAPFVPGVGNDLGFCTIINEDDGPGRASFMGWFGCAHSKQLDLVGDLLLLE
ncbi:MAG TPA: hypothetical protein DCZ94_02675 [Lentisphaeria bacterium]|nr:MAG: hypothetical protein A2X48_08170 [Lentisphaerae bacterium GWF2_49_21]HBC85838.1 hypothetical protein [Lentisphaeria bacterium]